MRTPVLLVAMMAACAGPAAAGGIAVGEEFVVAAEGPGKAARGTPHLAGGQGTYLAVWREGWHGKGGGARVFAARISRGGKVLDTRGVEVGACDRGVQVHPRVAFGGGVFLVVWQDFRNGNDHDILAARVSRLSGKVLDARPIAVATGPRSQVLPDVASDGKRFLVAWQGIKKGTTSFEGYAAPVGADGVVGAAVATGATPQPRLAWNGEKYLVAYGMGHTEAAILNADGTPSKKVGWVIGRSKGACYSVCGVPGDGWLVVGHRNPPDPWGWGGPGAMRCGFVHAAGTLENRNAIKEPSGNWSKLPNWLDVGGRERKTWPWGASSIAWDGAHCVVVWQRHHITGEKKSSFTNCDLMAARVDGWKPVDADGIPVAASKDEEKSPALASVGPGELLCVYERHRGDGTVVIAARTLETPTK